MSLKDIRRQLARLADKKQAKILERFFKTGPGEYASGDKFLGIKVPVTRSIAKAYCDLNLKDVAELLRSDVHEERLAALLILIFRFDKGDEKTKEEVYDLYLNSTEHINNWDLVDLSAKFIVGAFLFDKNRDVLIRLARSKDLWERRIAILATFYFIGKGDFGDTLKVSEMLLSDKHDLIHKAVGWLLREIGKRDQVVEENFLKEHYKVMPRTMLRYAIERFPESRRQAYLKGKI